MRLRKLIAILQVNKTTNIWRRETLLFLSSQRFQFSSNEVFFLSTPISRKMKLCGNKFRTKFKIDFFWRNFLFFRPFFISTPLPPSFSQPSKQSGERERPLKGENVTVGCTSLLTLSLNIRKKFPIKIKKETLIEIRDSKKIL